MGASRLHLHSRALAPHSLWSARYTNPTTLLTQGRNGQNSLTTKQSNLSFHHATVPGDSSDANHEAKRHDPSKGETPPETRNTAPAEQTRTHRAERSATHTTQRQAGRTHGFTNLAWGLIEK